MHSAWDFDDSTASRCLSGLELLLGTLIYYLLRKVFPIIYSENLVGKLLHELYEFTIVRKYVWQLSNSKLLLKKQDMIAQ